MVGLLWLAMLVLSDNIEIHTKNFDEMQIEGLSLCSKDIKNANSVKVSYLGSSLYKMHQVSPGVFELVDHTVHIQDMEPSPLKINFEYKICGLQTFVWKFVLFSIIVAITSACVISWVFNRLGPIMAVEGLSKS